MAVFEGAEGPARRLNDDDDEEDVLNGRTVWLAKRGEGVGLFTGAKRRFFVLALGQQSGLLKFNYYADVRDGLPHGKKGAIELYPACNVAADGNTLVIVSTSRCVMCLWCLLAWLCTWSRC